MNDYEIIRRLADRPSEEGSFIPYYLNLEGHFKNYLHKLLDSPKKVIANNALWKVLR